MGADKARDVIGQGHLGREHQGKGTQENCSAMWLTVSGFMGMGLVSQLSLASRLAQSILGLAQGPSWWWAPTSLSRDLVQHQGFWEVGCLLPPTDPSLILPLVFSAMPQCIII